MESITTQEGTQVLQEVNKLKTEAMVFVVIVLLMVGLFLLIRQHMASKVTAKVEKQKQDRAEAFTNAMSKLATSMNEHTAKDEQMVEQLNETIRSVGTTLGRVDSCVNALLIKQAGTINHADSERMIKDRFVKDIRRTVGYIVERSLTENDYVNRKGYVERKVKTDIATVLTEARKDLSTYDLAINPTKFFRLSPEAGVERFILCDLIWNEIEPLFRMETSLKQRIEEMNLIVQNTINDYVNKIHEKKAIPRLITMTGAESSSVLNQVE